MATNPQDIIEAIDSHILTKGPGPGELTLPTGDVVRYRSLEELRETRKYYAGLVKGSTPTRQFHIGKFVGGSAR